jgi:hypothetical protein
MFVTQFDEDALPFYGAFGQQPQALKGCIIPSM